MPLSARNQFPGVVKSIRHGAVMSEVESAILIVCVGHLICTELEASVNWSV